MLVWPSIITSPTSLAHEVYSKLLQYVNADGFMHRVMLIHQVNNVEICNLAIFNLKNEMKM